MSNHRIIASLDPLDAVREMHAVPARNRARDVAGLVQSLGRLVTRARRIVDIGCLQAAAAMRDIGIFLGSLRRHGVEPVPAVPHLEAQLLRLGRITGLPPRDTLLHYTVWNPVGVARRRYTDAPAEAALVASVRVAMEPLEKAIATLVELYDVSLTASDFAPLCRDIGVNLQHLIDGTLLARKEVPSDVFANQLRPYFDPVDVAGQPYLGPGAVEMPLFLLDHILWGALLTEPWYVTFKERYVPYILPSLQQVYHRHRNGPSLIDKALVTANRRGPAVQRKYAGLLAIRELCSILVRFRAPHARMAEGAYEAAEATAEGPAREVGSGGYAPQLLRDLLALTRVQRSRVNLELGRLGYGREVVRKSR